MAHTEITNDCCNSNDPFIFIIIYQQFSYYYNIPKIDIKLIITLHFHYKPEEQVLNKVS